MKPFLGPGIGRDCALGSHSLFHFLSVLDPAAMPRGSGSVILWLPQPISGSQLTSRHLKLAQFIKGKLLTKESTFLFGPQFSLFSCGWLYLFSKTLLGGDGQLSGKVGPLASDTQASILAPSLVGLVAQDQDFSWKPDPILSTGGGVGKIKA